MKKNIKKNIKKILIPLIIFIIVFLCWFIITKYFKRINPMEQILVEKKDSYSLTTTYPSDETLINPRKRISIKKLYQ